MQQTSQIYKNIMAGNHVFEVSVVLGESGRLTDERNSILTFGGTALVIARSGGDSGYNESLLKQVSITRKLFSDESPSVGKCVSGEISIEMIHPTAEIPRKAVIVPYVRVKNETDTSEWIQKGVYYIDTRSSDDDGCSTPILNLHGYDAMLLTEMAYPNTALSFPASDIDVVKDIASAIGVSVDSRTVAEINKGYTVQLPEGYSCREVLGYIAAMYGGNFIMNDLGELLFVKLNSAPVETRLLVDKNGYALKFGGDRIVV